MGDDIFPAWVLRKIKYVFMLERVAWTRSVEERLTTRLEKEVPIINELIYTKKSSKIGIIRSNIENFNHREHREGIISSCTESPP